MSNAKKDFIKFRTIRGISVNRHWVAASYPPHWHSAAEFTVALKDDGRYRVCDEDIILNKGDILLVWPRQVHETISIPRESSLLVHFVPGLIENNLDLTTASPFLCEYHKIDAKQYPELAAAIGEKLFEICELYEHRSYFSESRCKIKVMEILLMLGEFALSQRNDHLVANIYSDSARKHIQMALAYIDEHFSDDISQTDVAEYIGLSPYYFSRMFKKHMQKSMPIYLAELRVRNAMRLLTDTELSITECAFHSGFQSITAFNKVFREIIGCSPREYRKVNFTEPPKDETGPENSDPAK